MLMIDECLKLVGKINEWEYEFLTSIKGQMAGGRSLSDRQEEKLDNIWSRVTK